MRIQFRKDKWHGFLYKVIDIDRIYILVINDMEEIVKPVAPGIDDVEPVAREMVGIERTYHDAYDDTKRQ